MLFADAGTDHPSTWIAVANSGIGVATLFVVSLFAWLGSRDRSRIAALEERTEQCERNHADCQSALAEAKEELKARDAKDRSELEAKIADLSGRVDARKSEPRNDR